MAQPQNGSTGQARENGRAVRDDRERYSTDSVGYGTGAEGDSSQPAWRSRSLLAETARAGLADAGLADAGLADAGLADDREPPSRPGVSPELGPPRLSSSEGARREPRVVSPTMGRWYREPLAVADLMTRDVKTVSADTPITEVAALMRDEDVGVIPVVDATGRLDGIVTDRDLVVRALAGMATESFGKTLGDVCAGLVSTKDVAAVSPHDSIPDVLHLMGRKQIRRAPVVGNDRRLIGMISLGDIAKHADNDHELQDALQHISARRSFWSRIWR